MDNSAISHLPLAMNKSAFLQPIKKAGNVRIPGDYASRNLLAANALRTDSPQNPQDVILSWGQSHRPEGAFRASGEPIGRAQKIEHDFLLQRCERAAFPNLFT